MAAAVAFINAFIRKNSIGIGNFWVYLTRSLFYILLPLAIILSLVLVSQGCIDNFHPYVHAQTLEGKEQIIAQGPVASQIAIKHLGTSGGGFFTANSAHPYENPTPFTDYLELLSMLIIAAAFPFAFGALVKNRAQGWAIFIAMMLLFVIGLGFAMWSESHGNPLLAKLGIHNVNMEGKEMRLGTLASVVFSSASTATSTGAMNASLDSLMPLTGLVCIFNMAIGGVIFGGVGSGFIGMLFYGILAMFLIGLMIGRTPEIYGKKLEPYEMVITVIALFLPCIFQLILSAIAAATNIGIASLENPASHGLSEIIYTYASSISNNGSAFMGLNANVPFYNLTTGFAMLFGRCITIISALAIAGSMVQKKINPPIARFPTTSSIICFCFSCGGVYYWSFNFLSGISIRTDIGTSYLFWLDKPFNVIFNMRTSMLWNSKFIMPAIRQAFIKLNPLKLWHNVVMFVVEIGAIVTTVITVVSFFAKAPQFFAFGLQISLWLWFTVLFANFAESLAEGKGKAQAESLKQNRSEVYAQRIIPGTDNEVESVPALMLKKGDIVIVSDGMMIPSDGEIIEGIALVDESAITGESAPVVRESGGDKTGVTGGTKILSGKIKIEIKS